MHRLFASTQTIVALLTFMVLSGCQASSATDARLANRSKPPTSFSVSQQLIIKFRAGSSICTKEGMAELSAATDVPLQFIRLASGEACVVLQFGRDETHLLQGQAVLRQQPAVEWVERDAMMKAL